MLLALMVLNCGMVVLVQGLLCSRCETHGSGKPCEVRLDPRHLREYGEDEPCLSFEEANRQYLDLQRLFDGEWYFSARNGDHGLPLQLLMANRTVLNPDPNNILLSSSPIGVSLLVREPACLVVRSAFHHNFGNEESLQVDWDLPNVLWFRECVFVPVFPSFPVCAKSPIYRGQVHLCACRTDYCNSEERTAALLLVGNNSALPSSPPQILWNLCFYFSTFYFLLIPTELIK